MQMHIQRQVQIYLFIQIFGTVSHTTSTLKTMQHHKTDKLCVATFFCSALQLMYILRILWNLNEGWKSNLIQCSPQHQCICACFRTYLCVCVFVCRRGLSVLAFGPWQGMARPIDSPSSVATHPQSIARVFGNIQTTKIHCNNPSICHFQEIV